MVKAKFGDSLLSKPDTAMVNEALCKRLCRNVCRPIGSTFAPGIEAHLRGGGSRRADRCRGGPISGDAVMAREWA